MRFNIIGRLIALAGFAVAVTLTPVQISAQGGDTILKPADMQKLLAPAVYYKGQSAPTQLRNSGGVKFADGSYVLSVHRGFRYRSGNEAPHPPSGDSRSGWRLSPVLGPAIRPVQQVAIPGRSRGLQAPENLPH